jgi:hypothetical protein
VHTCLHAIDGCVFALGLVTLCNDGWDPGLPSEWSVLPHGDIQRERRCWILLAASFAVFRHCGVVELVIDGEFRSGNWRNWNGSGYGS